MNSEIISIGDSVLSAVLNGVYQGTLLSALVWIAFKLLTRTNAATRHAVGFATLIIVAILPAAHFFPRLSLKPVSEDSSGLLSPNISKRPNGGWIETEVPSEGATLQERPSTLPLVYRGEIEMPSIEGNIEPRFSTFTQPERTSSFYEEAFSTLKGFILSIPNQSWSLTLPPGSSVVVLSVWGTISTVLLLRLLHQYFTLRSLKKEKEVIHSKTHELFRSVSVEQGMKRKAQLIACSSIKTPIVAGFFRPAVLLPKSLMTDASADELQRVFRHELAHLSRYDDFTNLLQQLIKAVFFFHPGIFWLSRCLSLQREIACDDQVLALHHSARNYALFLTEFAARSKCRDFVAAPAAWSNKGQLKQRICMILNKNRNNSPRLSKARTGLLGMAAVLTALITLCVGPRVLIAQDEVPSEPAAPSAVVVAINPAPPEEGVAVVRGPMLASTPLGPLPAAGIIAAPPEAPDVLPTPPRPKAKRRDGDDLEQRLARLETLVSKLLSEDKGKRKEKGMYENFNFDLKGPWFNQNENRKFKDELNAARLSEEDIAKIKEEARKSADMGRREAARAVRELEKARAMASADSRNAQNNALIQQDDVKKQYRTLEQQHRALEKQMRDLERQMQKIERENQKVDHDSDNEQGEHSDNSDTKPPKHKEKQ